MLLVFDQSVYTIQRNSSVVADDTSASVCIRKPCDDMAGTACAHFRSISIKHTVVMCFSVFCEEFHDCRIHMISVFFTCFHCHTDTSVRLQGTLKRLVRLEPYDFFLSFVKISRSMGSDSGNNLCVHIQDSAFCAFLFR